MSTTVESFSDLSVDPPVRGFLHRPVAANGDGLIFTHGAGGNCQGPFLIALAEAFAGAGFAVLRYNLPFRQARAFGPPRPSEAARDRQGIRNSVLVLRQQVKRNVIAGGHSYGGRQTSMLAADEPELIQALLLTSYPLHPPGKPDQLRTEHLPRIQAPALFVEGTKDPFGSIAEIQAAVKLIPAKTALLPVADAGHDLGFKGKSRNEELPGKILEAFRKLMS
ncbi:MAG TPA: alpha/beta fold hydrolase [Terriglobales bacterium]